MPQYFGNKVVINGVECAVYAGTEETRYMWGEHPRALVDGQLYAYSIGGMAAPTAYAIEG